MNCRRGNKHLEPRPAPATTHRGARRPCRFLRSAGEQHPAGGARGDRDGRRAAHHRRRQRRGRADVPLRRGRAARPAAARCRRARRATRGAGANLPAISRAAAAPAAHRRIHARRPDGSSFPAEITLSVVAARGAEGRPRRRALILDRSEQAGCSASSTPSSAACARCSNWRRWHLDRRQRGAWYSPTGPPSACSARPAAGRPAGLRGCSAPSRDALRAQVARALQGEARRAGGARPRGACRRQPARWRSRSPRCRPRPHHGADGGGRRHEQRREGRRAAGQSREALRRLSASVVEAREERRRIARSCTTNSASA